MSENDPFYTVVEFAGHLDEAEIREALKRFLPQEVKNKIAVLPLHALSNLAKEVTEEGWMLAASRLLSKMPGSFTESIACSILQKAAVSYVLVESDDPIALEGLIPIYRNITLNHPEGIFLYTPKYYSFKDVDPSLEELEELRKTLSERPNCFIELPVDAINASELAQKAGFQGIFFRLTSLAKEESAEKSFA